MVKMENAINHVPNLNPEDPNDKRELEDLRERVTRVQLVPLDLLFRCYEIIMARLFSGISVTLQSFKLDQINTEQKRAEKQGRQPKFVAPPPPEPTAAPEEEMAPAPSGGFTEEVTVNEHVRTAAYALPQTVAEDAAPSEIVMVADFGTQAYRSGGTATALAPPLPAAPSTIAPEVTKPERPSNVQSFVHDVDPTAGTVAAMPALGTRAYPILPDAGRNGGTASALAPPLPAPYEDASPADAEPPRPTTQPRFSSRRD